MLALASLLAEAVSTRTAVLIGVVIACSAPLVALLGPLRRVQRLEDLVEAPLPTDEAGTRRSG